MANEKKRIEISDELLDQVAGGYSDEEWRNMSTEERDKAVQESMMMMMMNKPCALQK